MAMADARRLISRLRSCHSHRQLCSIDAKRRSRLGTAAQLRAPIVSPSSMAIAGALQLEARRPRLREQQLYFRGHKRVDHAFPTIRVSASATSFRLASSALIATAIG